MPGSETTMYFVNDIIVPKGRRKVNEDRVKELAESIAEVGQLQPIVVIEDHEAEKARLVVGAHRLSAFKMLKLDRICATISTFSKLDAELAEIDENLIRAELTAAERAKLTAKRKKIYLAKYPQTKTGGAPGKAGGGKKPIAKESKLDSFVDSTSSGSGRSKTRVREDVRRGEKVDGKVLDDIAGTDLDTGVNLDTLSKLPPKRQQEVVAHAREKGIDNLKTAKKSLEKDESIKEIEEEPKPLPEGPFRVIAADPPWPYDRTDDPTHRGSITYHKMDLEDIEALAVEAMAHDDCVLWLWTTNSFMHEAYHVVEAWGFKPKTVLTWVKPKMGVGNYLRNITEHCIVAVRGKPVFNLTNQTTELRGEVREHSRKPEEFYELVEGLCPGSKVEMFSREDRENWSSWGSETKFEGQDGQEDAG
jgi:N6-adenosine-specific RNA methylase IME4